MLIRTFKLLFMQSSSSGSSTDGVLYVCVCVCVFTVSGVGWAIR